MTLELIIFIASILFGALLYWRESQGNGVYRFFNKLMNSKELQMKPDNKKGFIYQQPILLRLVYITALFLIGIVVVQFLIPIDFNLVSVFSSMIIGTLGGTYLANFIFKSTEVIEDKTDSLEDLVSDAVEKGKEFIEDLKPEDKIEEVKSEPKKEIKAPEKSARERLKDKGLM